MKTIRMINTAVVICLAILVSLAFGQVAAFGYEANTGAKIPVNCLRVSDDSERTYSIKIEAEDEQAPAPYSDILYISEDGTAYFEIDITEPGTYGYKVYELEGDDPDIKYDSTVYSVKLFVENGSGNSLIYNVIVGKYGSDDKNESVEFGNTIRVTGEPGEGSDSQTDSEPEPEDSQPQDRDSDAGASNPITGFIGRILTGNSLPAHAVRFIMLAFLMTVISAFLFRRGSREGEEKK